ncbi:armadillo-type protein [Mycena latifolia]|nr:armadillo-type protein [Mycena latifolia]
MPPLTRQQTFQNILSWWSDSNPPGPTINLHAAAKPLMKLLYHREALAFMKSNRDIPFSPETLEIYSSYLSWKYVSSATKIAILEELKTRARSEEDAWVLLHSNMVYTIFESLRSTSYFDKLDLRREAEAILRNLARHSASTRAAIVEPIVALLCHSDVNDEFGFYYLRNIVDSLEGTEGIVAANALHYLLDGLGSPSPDVRKAACRLTQWLAEQQSTVAAVLDFNPCKQIVAISSAADDYEVCIASDALIAIANWPDGAEAAVAAHMLDHVPKWFASPHEWMGGSACQLLAKLARHKDTAGAVMDLKPCAQLVTMLEFRHSEDYFASRACDALTSIANWPDGAEAVVAAKALDHVQVATGNCGLIPMLWAREGK